MCPSISFEPKKYKVFAENPIRLSKRREDVPGLKKGPEQKANVRSKPPKAPCQQAYIFFQDNTYQRS